MRNAPRSGAKLIERAPLTRKHPTQLPTGTVSEFESTDRPAVTAPPPAWWS